MIDHREIIKKMQEGAPKGMTLKGVYKDKDGMTVMGYLAKGYVFYTLTPQERQDASKRQAKIGSMYLDPEGHIKVGDLVVMMATDEQVKEEKLHRHDTATSRLRAASYGNIPEDLRLKHIFTHVRGEEPDDRKPNSFRDA